MKSARQAIHMLAAVALVAATIAGLLTVIMFAPQRSITLDELIQSCEPTGHFDIGKVRVLCPRDE